MFMTQKNDFTCKAMALDNPNNKSNHLATAKMQPFNSGIANSIGQSYGMFLENSRLDRTSYSHHIGRREQNTTTKSANQPMKVPQINTKHTPPPPPPPPLGDEVGAELLLVRVELELELGEPPPDAFPTVTSEEPLLKYPSVATIW